MREYREAAKKIKQAAIDNLFSPELDSFVRYGHELADGTFVRENIVDASTLFGLWYFGMFDQTDELFAKTQQQVKERLTNQTDIGGVIRYEHDEYFRSTDKSNPWFITTLWEAQRKLVDPDVNSDDIEYAKGVLAWVESHMYPSGVLAEQLNPYTGESLSATPLAWSHAVYVETVLLYIEALEKNKMCVDCDMRPVAEL